jgi:hypothetical protein
MILLFSERIAAAAARIIVPKCSRAFSEIRDDDDEIAARWKRARDE